MITIKPTSEHGHLHRLWSIYLAWAILGTILYFFNHTSALPTDLEILIPLGMLLMLAIVSVALAMFYWQNLRFYLCLKVWPASQVSQLTRWVAIQKLVEDKFYQAEQRLVIAAAYDFNSSIAQEMRQNIEIADEESTGLLFQLPRYTGPVDMMCEDGREIIEQKIHIQKLRRCTIWWYNSIHPNGGIIPEDVKTICKN